MMAGQDKHVHWNVNITAWKSRDTNTTTEHIHTHSHNVFLNILHNNFSSLHFEKKRKIFPNCDNAMMIIIVYIYIYYPIYRKPKTSVSHLSSYNTRKITKQWITHSYMMRNSKEEDIFPGITKYFLDFQMQVKIYLCGLLLHNCCQLSEIYFGILNAFVKLRKLFVDISSHTA